MAMRKSRPGCASVGQREARVLVDGLTHLGFFASTELTSSKVAISSVVPRAAQLRRNPPARWGDAGAVSLLPNIASGRRALH